MFRKKAKKLVSATKTSRLIAKANILAPFVTKNF